jgi:cytochrome b subunit of formate dehydrogenase
MRKHTQNKYIDGVLFIALLVLLVTGIIMYVVLPPGGHDKVWLSLTRHEWGDIHFWTAVIFTVVIAVHLLLHSSWIVKSYNLFKGKKGQL